MLGIVQSRHSSSHLILAVTPRGRYGYPILKPRLLRLLAPVMWMDAQGQSQVWAQVSFQFPLFQEALPHFSSVPLSCFSQSWESLNHPENRLLHSLFQRIYHLPEHHSWPSGRPSPMFTDWLLRMPFNPYLSAGEVRLTHRQWLGQGCGQGRTKNWWQILPGLETTAPVTIR